jgi:hypothetical protein
LYNGAFHFIDGANVAPEYVYDKNGNLKKDYNKKIVDIPYNALNLLTAIVSGGRRGWGRDLCS